jgi:retron-type reverse transcriptase
MGQVRALQRLLIHSYSGKVLAVRRVTENNGKKTPGVDQEIWDTPERKTQGPSVLLSAAAILLDHARLALGGSGTIGSLMG